MRKLDNICGNIELKKFELLLPKFDVLKINCILYNMNQ